MRLSYNHNDICFVFLFLVASCTSNNKNLEANDSTTDSIINAQLRVLVDSTLIHSDLNLKVEQLSISTSYTNNDTIKNVTGKGSTNRYNRYGNEKFDITGSYKVSHNMLNCKSLKVDHSDVGTVFSVFEKYDTLLTYCMDSITFSKKHFIFPCKQSSFLKNFICHQGIPFF